MFEGYTCLELMRKGKVVHRVEHKNTITPWVKNAMNKGNFNFAISPEKIVPLKQWYGGCLLTDKDNDPTISMIAQDSNVVAQASNNAYMGTNLRRGSFNTNESRDVTGGYRFVWDWTTSQGNGTIKSVCLTREAFGATDITSDFSAPSADCIEYLSPRTIRGSSMPGYITVLDYERERAFSVVYDSTSGSEKITIKEYFINTFRYHLTGKFGDAISLVNTHEISQVISNWSGEYTSVSYTGDYFYIFRVYNNAGTMDEYKISTADWTCVKTVHTFNGVYFRNHTNTGGYLQKDLIPVIDGYAWAYSYNNSKIYKLNLSNDADVVEYANPIATVSNHLSYNGPAVLLPNGDWYKFNTAFGEGTAAVYHHNDTFFRVRGNVISGNDWGEGTPSIHANQYGTCITTAISDDYTNGQNWLISTLYPYVSTVNNLETAVTKASDLTMKLTYEVKRAVA